MFSEKAKKNAEACRFCWMCRHLCPVQLVTGKETNTPRAKGLQVSMIERGMPFDMDVAKTMYECMLCGACTNDCVTGFDPLIFIREGRTQANVQGVVPAYVQKVIDRVVETGNIYGASETKVDFAGIPERGDTLVWLGATARYSTPCVANALFAVLKTADVPFAALKNEPASGSALGDLMGFVEDVRAQAVKAGERALTSLKSAKSKLDEAKSWGVVDILGGGIVSSLIKRSKMDDANAYIEQAKRDLARFGKELHDVQGFKDLGIKTDGFFPFADWFMDSTFADFVMQDRINNARDQVNKAIDRVESILRRLKAK